MELIRFNLPPLPIKIEEVERITVEGALLAVYLKNGEKLTGYLIKN